MTAASRRWVAHALLAFLLAGAVAAYLHWPALTDADIFHDNWRQCPQWLSPDKQHFQEDDLLLRYSEFGTSPFGNALYKTLALTGYDIVWGKIVALLVFALGALSTFLVARAMSGLTAAWVATLIFLFFPSLFRHFVGGYMATFSYPLLAFAVLLVYRQRWWWAIPVVGASSLIYPMVALHIGVLLIVDFLAHDVASGRVFRDGELWRRKILPLALAAGLLVVLISFKYLGDHGFGELVTREHMQDHIDFTEDGRYRLLPTVSHWHRFENFFANWFHIPFLLFAVFALGRNAFRLPRGLVSLMVASLVMYTVADIFVMRFYLPSRYIRRSFPLFAAVVGGIWWARIYHETRARSGTVVPLVWVTVALACLGVTEWGHRFEPGSRTRTYDRHELYDAIRALPGRPMLAAWPKLASELPLMTGKTVLVNQEQAHPWWTDYYAEVTDRTHAFFRAHYTNDPAELRDVIARYGIDYWVLQPRQYRRGYTHKSRKHFEPFATWLREEIATGPNALLNNIPPKYWHWYGGKYRIVASTSVLAWLRETRRVRE